MSMGDFPIRDFDIQDFVPNRKESPKNASGKFHKISPKSNTTKIIKII